MTPRSYAIVLCAELVGFAIVVVVIPGMPNAPPSFVVPRRVGTVFSIVRAVISSIGIVIDRVEIIFSSVRASRDCSQYRELEGSAIPLHPFVYIYCRVQTSSRPRHAQGP